MLRRCSLLVLLLLAVESPPRSAVAAKNEGQCDWQDLGGVDSKVEGSQAMSAVVLGGTGAVGEQGQPGCLGKQCCATGVPA